MSGDPTEPQPRRQAATALSSTCRRAPPPASHSRMSHRSRVRPRQPSGGSLASAPSSKPGAASGWTVTTNGPSCIAEVVCEAWLFLAESAIRSSGRSSVGRGGSGSISWIRFILPDAVLNFRSENSTFAARGLRTAPFSSSSSEALSM